MTLFRSVPIADGKAAIVPAHAGFGSVLAIVLEPETVTMLDGAIVGARVELDAQDLERLAEVVKEVHEPWA